jgi:hypothetical protein
MSIRMNKLIKQKLETNEQRIGLSILPCRIMHNVKELTVKNLKVYSLNCPIENLQSALYYTLQVVLKEWLTNAWSSEDT